MRKGEVGGACGRMEMHTGSWFWHLMGKDHLEDLGVGGKLILKWIFQEVGWGGKDWFHLEGGRRLCTRQWTLGFCKIREISWLLGNISVSRTVLHGVCMDLLKKQVTFFWSWSSIKSHLGHHFWHSCFLITSLVLFSQPRSHFSLSDQPLQAPKCEHNRYTICYLFRHFCGVPSSGLP